MIKRDITETVYEYDKEGKLVRKTVTETHEEENNTITTYPSFSQLNGIETVPYNLATKAEKSHDCNCATASPKNYANITVTG